MRSTPTGAWSRRASSTCIFTPTNRVLEAGVQNGTTFFRLFADVGTIGGLRAAQGLLLARERFASLCQIQVVAFLQEGILRDPGAAELLDEAITQGCDVVGGLPWYEYTDADAREHIDMCFALAKRHDLDVHMLAARAARLDGYGIAPGQRADLVVIDAPSVHEALRTQPPRRHVIKDGHEVARATLLRELRRPDAPRRE